MINLQVIKSFEGVHCSGEMCSNFFCNFAKDENHLAGFVDIEKFEEELTTELFNLIILLQEELRSGVSNKTY